MNDDEHWLTNGYGAVRIMNGSAETSSGADMLFPVERHMTDAMTGDA